MRGGRIANAEREQGKKIMVVMIRMVVKRQGVEEGKNVYNENDTATIISTSASVSNELYFFIFIFSSFLFSFLFSHLSILSSSSATRKEASERWVDGGTRGRRRRYREGEWQS